MAAGPRVAIVGAGLMGRWHATYARRCGATVAAIVDRDGDAARRLAARCGAAAVVAGDGGRPAFAGVDVIHVCTPTISHAALAGAALDAGCHVVVEKPVAVSVAETRRLLELAADRRRSLVPVHQLPFQRGFLSLRRRLGELGELVDLGYRCFTAGAEQIAGDDRRRVLAEILPHPVSVFRALGLGPADWRRTTGDDDELVLVSAREKPRLGIHLSAVARPTRHELAVTGSRGSARVDFFHGYCVFDRDAGASRRSKLLRPFRLGSGLVLRAAANLAVRSLHREPAYPGLRPLLADFYTALASGGEVRPDAEILEAAAVIEMAGC